MPVDRVQLTGWMSMAALLVGPLCARGQANASGASVERSDSSGTVMGRLVDMDDAQPVPYATVMVVGSDRASFASEDGSFRVTRLAPGTFTVRARQIGYAPKDTVITIGPAPAVTTVVFRMRRLPALLGLVKVEGHRPKGCSTIGVPDSATDPTLAAVFAQLKENVDRFRLLLDTYPFRYSLVERRVLRSDPGGDPQDSTRAVDTLTYESRNTRPYHIGDVVYVGADPLGRTHEYMYLPTFRDLADPVFLAAHCFTYGGATPAQSESGPQLIRIDFVPARSIHKPDVRGSIYLDAHRLVVRRAVFELTNAGAVESPVIGYTVTTKFIELVPLAPVFDSIESVQLLPDGASYNSTMPVDRGLVHRAAITEDRLLAVTFEGQTPGGTGRPLSTPTSSTAALPPALRGRVVDSSGAPIQGAVLGLLGTADTVTTSDSGQFALRTVAPGAYMLSARHVGYREDRLPVSISTQHELTITVTLQPAVHVLPTVTTIAEVEAGYHAVGFDRRKKVGVGQFITYDQIVRRQATEVTQLFTGLNGVAVGQSHEAGDGSQHVGSNNTLAGTRGIASCVKLAIDGVPQVVRSDRDIDNLIQPSEVAAIEAYEPSEWPAGFGGGTLALPQVDRASASGADIAPQCSLIAIWTRARLGISRGGEASDSAAGTGRERETEKAIDDARGIPSFGSDSACEPPPSLDTAQLILRAILESATPISGQSSSAVQYNARVLDAIGRSFVFPTELTMPMFGLPFPLAKEERPESSVASSSLQVAPALSAVVVFTLDSSGALQRARLTVSSLSGAIDTSILAAVQRAAAEHQFPAGASGSRDARALQQFVLVVSTDEPTAGEPAAVLGRIDVPTWPLGQRASLGPEQVVGTSRAAAHDSVTFAFVVDPQGRAIRSTERILSVSDADTAAATRLGNRLPMMKFEPASIGRCPVSELVTQAFPVAPVGTP